MKTALVCGAAGFIGNHLCIRLKLDGYHVVGVDKKYPEFGRSAADEFNIFDLTNEPGYHAHFHRYAYDEVYQLAAEMGGAEYIFSGENDAEIMRKSALINLNVLEACRFHKVGKVFFSSSACVYGSLNDAHRKGCVEGRDEAPDSAYGWEKLFAEQLYDAYARNHGMEIRVARLHNVFGAYGTWRGGREKAPAALCRKIAEMGGTIEVFGDGRQTRSFLHVDECIDGVGRLMESDFSGPVNIGSDQEISINEMVLMIAAIANKVITIKNVDGPLGVKHRNSDNTLIAQKLGWRPSMRLEQGLRKLYPWIAEQVEKAR
jgi:GDP-D-mannose 3',5'-epimerase